MSMSRLLALVAVIASLCSPAVAQGSADLKTGRPEVVLSIGTTAHLVDMTTGGAGRLSGMPATEKEIRRGDVVPIEPNKLALAFSSSVPDRGKTRTAILTEDGMWAVAQLTGERGGFYFLREEQLAAMAAAPSGEWRLVAKPFVIRAGALEFGRGETIRIEPTAAGATLVIERDHPVTGSKFNDMTRSRSGSRLAGPVGGAFRIPATAAEVANLQPIDMGRVREALAWNRDERWPSTISDRLKRWNTTFRVAGGGSIECNQEQITTIDSSSGLKGDLTFVAGLAPKLPGWLAELFGIKLSVGAEAGAQAAWKKQEQLITRSKAVSRYFEQYILNFGSTPETIAVASARDCVEDGKRYFLVTVPTQPDFVVDKGQMKKMVARTKKLAMRESGHLSTACFSAFTGVIRYLVDELAIDERTARLITSRLVRVTGSPDGFYGC